MTSVILCIDRDNDLGRKTKFKGPVIGWEKNLEAAKALGLKDPTDTDVNAIFGALKIAKELKNEIVTLTGNEKVGIISDRVIAKQLDTMMKRLSPTSVIFVSDGLDDEQVIPMIQSRVKIDSVHRVVVRQSKELEKAYFKMANFMQEVMADPQLARLIFGLPGVILVLLAIGGIQAFNLIMAVIGVYLLIKGARLEDMLFDKMEEFIKSLSFEKLSTLAYFIAATSIGLAVIQSYQDLSGAALSFTQPNGSIHVLSSFVLKSNALSLLMLGFGTLIAAKVMDDWRLKNFIYVKKYLILGGFIIVLKSIFEAVARYVVENEYGLANFVFAGVLTVTSLGIWIKLCEYVFKPEIELIRHLIEDTEGKEVVTVDGEIVGKVKKVMIENLEVRDIHTKSHSFGKADIISIDDNVIVKGF